MKNTLVCEGENIFERVCKCVLFYLVTTVKSSNRKSLHAFMACGKKIFL